MPLRILHIPNKCTGCGACVSACSKRALSLLYNDEGFYFPHLDSNKCVNCRLCEKVCHCLHVNVFDKPNKEYYAFMLKANDIEIVKKSSSGGAFSLLANEIISKGGLVYGARYDYDAERLEHCSTDKCSIQSLRKSKYIESYMGDSIRDVLTKLKEGRKVLFCGTPCQVAGLYYYLKTLHIDMSNLLLVRFICHGVPSNRFFTEYKHYEEEKRKSKMISFDFRPKTKGWRYSEWKMTFANGEEEKGPYYYYYYYYYFQLSNTLRASCYFCRRVFDDIADITIGDFWGICKYHPENNDQEGISVLLAHNKKALRYVDAIKDVCQLERVPQTAVDYIYGEAKERSAFFCERERIMPEIVNNGYMAVAKQRLSSEIFKRKLKDRIYLIVKPFVQWKKKQ